MEFLVVSWPSLHTETFELAQAIEESGEKFDLIVAIARGGLTISHMLSDFLRLPITSFTITSYHDLKQHSTPIVTFRLGDELRGKRLLLVDDVSDTGKTFTRGVEYLREVGAENVRTVALFVKPHTEFTPDYHGREVSEWVVFPYDMRETVEALVKKFRAENVPLATIRERIETLGIPQQYVALYAQ